MKKLVLSVFALATAGFAFGQSDLIISEVVEGSGNNKGFEIFNPTDQAINLGTYQIKRFNNGALTPSGGTLDLDNVDLQPGDVWVVVNGQTTSTQSSPACDPAMQALADQLGGDYPDPCYNNGNDAVTLENNGVIVDIFGEIGFDPGTAWEDSVGAWWTKDHTLIRKPTVINGVTVNPSPFDVTAQWDTLPEDTWDSLGTHHIAFALSTPEIVERQNEVYVFPNPAVTDNIVVKGTDWVTAVSLYNTAGQLVLRERNNTARGDLYLNLDAKLNGLHILMVELKSGEVITRKLAIQ